MVNVYLKAAYTERTPNPDNLAERVIWDVWPPHRGTSLVGSFNRHHILAITQVAVEWRRERAVSGPVYVAMRNK